jgi:prophage regulatory protein
MTTNLEVRFLFAAQTGQRLGVSTSTVWRWAKERSDFPAPVKLGVGVTRWRVADLDAFEASKSESA